MLHHFNSSSSKDVLLDGSVIVYSSVMHSSPLKIQATGFTLIEMSIVLVIIGLIVGGVLVGQSLIRSSALNSVLTDISKFSAAASAFDAKYNCLAGDCPNASSLNLGTNGNGNGVIDEGLCNQNDVVQADNIELFTFWQHLGNAGMITGVYTGSQSASGPVTSQIGLNVPASKIKNAGYSLGNIAQASMACSSVTFTSGDYTNVIMFGAQRSGDRTVNPILTAAEAYKMDSKIDDGMPGTGHVLTLTLSWFQGANSTCVTGNTPTANYDVTSVGPTCHLIFNKAF